MMPSKATFVLGLSPRVRGNPCLSDLMSTVARSIPACAGEPLLVAVLLRLAAVYPRVCGGTAGNLYNSHRGEGLSPRVRGNLDKEWKDFIAEGSIPACAGEPFGIEQVTIVKAVYPRVCGGTS